MSQTRPTVAILVQPETTASVLYGLYDLLLSAGRDWGVVMHGEPGPQLIEPILVGRRKGRMQICNGVVAEVTLQLDECPEDALICVPEINVAPGTPLRESHKVEIEWLRCRYLDGATLATGCSGAVLFAEAGILDGYEATTHWAWCEDMQRRFPHVRVQGRRTLVVSGEGQRLIMAGGGSSFLDLAIYLIARLTDVETAMRVARVNLIDWHQIGQQPYALLTAGRQSDDALMGRMQRWVAEHYDRPSPVSQLIRNSGLPESTFKRRFRAATGMSPLDYVHAVRLEEAKHLLESTVLPVDSIASEVGYEDAGYFGRLFKRKVGITPAQYRRRFAQTRQQIGLGSVRTDSRKHVS